MQVKRTVKLNEDQRRGCLLKKKLILFLTFCWHGRYSISFCCVSEVVYSHRVKELRVRELTKRPHQYQRLQAACQVGVYLQKVLYVCLVFLIFPTLPCEACCAAPCLTEEES